MQSLGTVSSAQVLATSQAMRYKVEVYDGSLWVDLRSLGGKDYVKSVSLSLGGAGVSPDPVAGTWTAEIANTDAIFHPKNSASDYCDLLRVGRNVRISIGGVYGGAEKYWQRIIGYMDTPRFNHGTRTVQLKGTDYCQDLVDTVLRSPDNYWGTTQTYSTVGTVATLGSEIYDEADAMEIGAHEANNVTNWAATNATFSSEAETDLGSTYVGKLERNGASLSGYAINENVGAFTGGTTYQCTLKYRKVGTGTGALTCGMFKTGTTTLWGNIGALASTDVATASFQFTATETVAGRMKFEFLQLATGTYFQVDEISIKDVTDPGFNIGYELPADCNGPYYATLDGDPIYLGDPGESCGWQYGEDTRTFSFSDDAIITTGVNNLVVYYYTTQTVENVVADILVTAGLYADQAAALAAMDYTATGVTLDRVWFDAGTTCLAAIGKLCERVNYRFWFAYDGTPCFKSAPTAGTPDFTFASVDDLAEEEMYEDLNEVKNTIVIEGMEQAMYGSTEKTQTSRLSGKTSDATSIAAYREKVKTVTNHLFQDDASITAMLATLLAAYKDPKWYTNVTTRYNAAPVELGDTVRYTIQLEAAYGWPLYGEVAYGTATYASNGTQVTIDGLVRDIKITDDSVTYVCDAGTATLTGEDGEVVVPPAPPAAADMGALEYQG